MVTLGISTNTRLLGLAIIKQDVLLDYSIHLHKSPWSPSKANEIITSLEPCVRKYCIKNVVLSMPHEYHQTEAFKYLASRIKLYFKQKNIPFHTQTQEALYCLCSPEEKKTKKAIMIALTLQFPQLTYCCQKELRNKNRYYNKVFEAVAVATLHNQIG
jgi:hypothetical protein